MAEQIPESNVNETEQSVSTSGSTQQTAAAGDDFEIDSAAINFSSFPASAPLEPSTASLNILSTSVVAQPEHLDFLQIDLLPTAAFESLRTRWLTPYVEPEPSQRPKTLHPHLALCSLEKIQHKLLDTRGPARCPGQGCGDGPGTAADAASSIGWA